MFLFHFSIAALVAFSVASVCAEPCAVETSNALGVQRVLSASTNTIVAVPWTAFSTNVDAAVRVVDLVRTQGLSDGDLLHVPTDGDAYVSWRLEERTWQPLLSVSRAGVAEGRSADAVVLPRGRAFWLVRQRPRDEKGEIVPFYLAGQCASASMRPEIRAGTPTAPVYHMLANPLDRAVGINELDWTGAGAADTIVVPSGSASGVDLILTCADGTWGYWDSQKVWDPRRNKYKIQQSYVTALSIPAGTGFWYVSRGGTPAPEWR